jgi:hypothetical protein
MPAKASLETVEGCPLTEGTAGAAGSAGAGDGCAWGVVPATPHAVNTMSNIKTKNNFFI